MGYRRITARYVIDPVRRERRRTSGADQQTVRTKITKALKLLNASTYH
jgi:hypothetical protein